MALEDGTSIGDLDPQNPRPGDPKSRGDDHIRLIKKLLKLSFPFVAGPVPIAHDQFASKAFVINTAFETILPGQPGGTVTYRLVTRDGVTSWKDESIYIDKKRLAEAHAIALSIG